MKPIFHLFGIVVSAGLMLAPAPVRADGELSTKNLDVVDQWGWFTPGFKTEVHELVETKQAAVIARQEDKDIEATLPDLRKQVTDTQAKVDLLKQQLAEYDHADQTEFVQLQKLAGDASAKPEDVRIAAQAYLWAYLTSPHQADAQQILQTVQKKIADQIQADKDAATAKAAARVLLLQRVQAKQLSLSEWRDFLRDLSQEDVIKYLGRPTSGTVDQWTYIGEWTEDPETNQKIGLQIDFNAARVNNVHQAAAR